MKRHVLAFALVTSCVVAAGCRDEKAPARPIVREHDDTSAHDTIVIEAEDFTGELEPPVTVAEDADASGGRCIHIEGGSGKPGDVHPVTLKKYPPRWGAAVYSFEVTRPGRYRLWGRKFWENGCGNSLTLVVNGRAMVFGEDGTYDRWEWLPATGLLELPQGENTLEVLNREDGVRLDKLILTTDLDFIPQGKE